MRCKDGKRKRLLGIRRMEKVPIRIKQLCGVTKSVDEKIDEGVFRCFGHVERMENDRITKRVCEGECPGSRSVGRPRKRWTDTVKQCLNKRDLDVRQARIMVHDRSVWGGFVRGECMERCPGDEPLTLTRCCNSYVNPLK